MLRRRCRRSSGRSVGSAIALTKMGSSTSAWNAWIGESEIWKSIVCVAKSSALRSARQASGCSIQMTSDSSVSMPGSHCERASMSVR